MYSKPGNDGLRCAGVNLLIRTRNGHHFLAVLESDNGSSQWNEAPAHRSDGGEHARKQKRLEDYGAENSKRGWGWGGGGDVCRSAQILAAWPSQVVPLKYISHFPALRASVREAGDIIIRR